MLPAAPDQGADSADQPSIAALGWVSAYADRVPSAPTTQLVRIETPDLLLREFLPTDVPDLLASFADAEIARWNPGPEGPEAAAEFTAGRNDWSDGEHASWAIADLKGRLIGSVSLHKIEPDQGDAEIGYWIAPWARRRGQAVRSVRAACRFGFGDLGLHRLYLYHAVESPGPAESAGPPGSGTRGRSASLTGTPTAPTTTSICTAC